MIPKITYQFDEIDSIWDNNISGKYTLHLVDNLPNIDEPLILNDSSPAYDIQAVVDELHFKPKAVINGMIPKDSYMDTIIWLSEQCSESCQIQLTNSKIWFESDEDATLFFLTFVS